MIHALEPPRTVVVAGVGDERRDGLRDSLLAGIGEAVEFVDSAERAVELVSTAERVGCLVTTPRVGDATGPALCARVKSVDEDLPVVLYGDTEERTLLEMSLDAGVDGYVATEDRTALRETVDEELERYRRRAVQAEESSILDTILDSLGKSIYVKDEEARHVKMADVPGGFDPEEAIGETDVGLYGDDDPEAARRAVEDDLEVIETGEPKYDVDEPVGQEGREWMRTTKVPWTHDGEVKGLVGLTLNVTDYKKKERDLDVLRRRFESYTSRISHDIKTPLQVASGHLEIARETGDEAALDEVAATLDRIDEIVDDYDTLSEQTGTVAENPDPAPLAAVARDVWDVIDSKDATLVVDVDEDVRTNATEQMIRPVLENLFKNAVEHAGSDVTVTLGRTESGFYVEDDGEGLPEEGRERVLEQGFTTAEDGSGRGLSIVTDEVEKNLWSLDVGSSAGGGARFEVGDCLATDESSIDSGNGIEIDETADVGDLEVEGHAIHEAEFDRWYVAGDGEDMFRQDNDFYYAYAELDGDASVRGKILDVEYVDSYSKGGFMIRGGLEPDAAYGYVGKTPGHGTELLWRETPGADGQSRQLEEESFAFDWYRIDRDGDVLRAYLSIDGIHWQELATWTVPLDDPVLVGMIACSCQPGRRCEVTYEDVSVTRGPQS